MPLRKALESVVVRFAGDSGDGMQLTGSQFAQTTALAANDLATFPDFPAEIRAPTGTTYGVSAFQINFGGCAVGTAGDSPDVLVVLNPAALKVNLPMLREGGQLIVDGGSFTPRNLSRAGYTTNPLEDGTLDDYLLLNIDISGQTLEVARPLGLGQKDALRCKNMWVLGLIYWIYDRELQPTIDWLTDKFHDKPKLAAANIAAIQAGHAYAETAELGLLGYTVPSAPQQPGLHGLIGGSRALALGLASGAHLVDLPMMFCSYPITPASSLLHDLAAMPELEVTTFQAEDEIAAICAAIGASYAGRLGVTASSGPGMALKTEALGLAIATELPLVVVNVQRGGPSTGLPTKTEQSDLYQAIWGRNGDAPVPVLAVCSPADGFYCAIEAVRLAVKYMTPVIVLSDGYIANASEPWLVPDLDEFHPFPVHFRTDPEGYQPFARDPVTLARDWVPAGTQGLEHRIGGIERDALSGAISYDPINHQRMSDLRAAKINGIGADIPLQRVDGPNSGDVVVVGWGSTYGAISRAVHQLREQGWDISHIHLRYLWPLPRNLGKLLTNFEQILVPEMNQSQLARLLRSEYLLPVTPLNKVAGQPFKIAEIEHALRRVLEGAAV